MIGVLLHRALPTDAVAAGMAEAIQTGRYDQDMVDIAPDATSTRTADSTSPSRIFTKKASEAGAIRRSSAGANARQ